MFNVSQWSQCAEPLQGEHFHAEAHFIFVTSGTYQSAAKGRPPDLMTELIYNPPQTVHGDRLATGAGSFLTISLAPPLHEELAEAKLPENPVHLSRTRSQLVVRRLAKALASPAPDKLAIESHCVDLIGHCSAPAAEDGPPSRWLAKVYEAVSEISEFPVSIGGLSRNVGVHPVHLVRSFKKAFGCTPGEMRSARRVSVAADLLTKSRRPLAEIAADCGYSDQSHFTNEFRRSMGFSPGRFRRLTAG
jgi:AraC family transcriptional regulator